ncbi:MAG: hypothetical protein ACQXXF_04445 [Thermoplasmatota archaeon]|jgi:hypothetical protein
MGKKPREVYILILLCLGMSFIFTIWGGYSLILVLQIPSWQGELGVILTAPLHFGYLTSTIVWFVFSAVFIIFAYGTLKGDNWVWSTGLIITTIFLIVLGLMLVSLMINSILFLDLFSVTGLVMVILAFIGDLAIVYTITRPATKIYFESSVAKK